MGNSPGHRWTQECDVTSSPTYAYGRLWTWPEPTFNLLKIRVSSVDCALNRGKNEINTGRGERTLCSVDGLPCADQSAPSSRRFAARRFASFVEWM